MKIKVKQVIEYINYLDRAYPGLEDIHYISIYGDGSFTLFRDGEPLFDGGTAEELYNKIREFYAYVDKDILAIVNKQKEEAVKV